MRSISNMDEIVDSMYSIYGVAVVKASLDLDIFEILNISSSLDNLSKQVSISKTRLLKILDVLVSYKLLNKVDEDYYVTALGKKSFIKDSKEYLGNVVRFFVNQIPMFLDITDTKEIPYDEAMLDMGNFYYDTFRQGLKGIDLTNKKLLDVGGGTGIYALKLKQEFNVDITCIDTNNCKELLGNKEIKYIKADFLKHKFDESFDVILLSNILHISDYHFWGQVIQKAYVILPVSGTLIIHEVFKDRGLSSNIFDLMLHLQTPKGGAITEDLITMLHNYKFKVINSKSFLPRRIVTAIKE